ncbi:interaptin-like [Episyrphus balteatus]|uniref:interaptin-like n=1 Tax=Episyrphus balteatus TaxID=286459 RepID=UPI00248601C2|nr:interaptin-like [Episyrphus balteatus]
MVQYLTTSFDKFETFALSEMPKQQVKIDSETAFIPKYWGNFFKYEPNDFETSATGSFCDIYSARRRSFRIANQIQPSYNENPPRKVRKTEKKVFPRKTKTSGFLSKSEISSCSSKLSEASSLNKALLIKNLFKKPIKGKVTKSKAKPKPRKASARKRTQKSCKVEENKLLLTKASLKQFEDGFNLKNEKLEFEDQSNFSEVEDFEEEKKIVPSFKILNQNKIMPQNKFGNLLKINKNDTKSTILKPSKEIKLKKNLALKTIENTELTSDFVSLQVSDTELPNKALKHASNDNSIENKPNKIIKLEPNSKNGGVKKKSTKEVTIIEDSDDEPLISMFKKVANDDGEDVLMKDVSNESYQVLEKKPNISEINKNSKKSIISESKSVEKTFEDVKNQALNLIILDESEDERQKSVQKIVENLTVHIEEIRDFSDKSAVKEISNEEPSSQKKSTISEPKSVDKTSEDVKNQALNLIILDESEDERQKSVQKVVENLTVHIEEIRDFSDKSAVKEISSEEPSSQKKSTISEPKSVEKISEDVKSQVINLTNLDESEDESEKPVQEEAKNFTGHIDEIRDSSDKSNEISSLQKNSTKIDPIFDFTKKKSKSEQNSVEDEEKCEGKISIPKEQPRNDKSVLPVIQIDEEISLIVDKLSTMNTTDTINKKTLNNKQTFKENKFFGSSIIDITDETPTERPIKNGKKKYSNSKTCYDDDEVIIIENKPLGKYQGPSLNSIKTKEVNNNFDEVIIIEDNNIKEHEKVIETDWEKIIKNAENVEKMPSNNREKYQVQQNKTISKQPNTNQTEMEVDEIKIDQLSHANKNNQSVIIEELHLLTDRKLQADARKLVPELTLTEIIDDDEVYAESNGSDTEIQEENENLADDRNEDENQEEFNRNSDDVEMEYPQEGQGNYQQDYIEVHGYNYLPQQNYLYPGFNCPVGLDYRSINLPYLGQRYGDFNPQMPQIYLGYNNFSMPTNNPYANNGPQIEEITECYDTEEGEEDENEKNKANLNKNQNDSPKNTFQDQPQSCSGVRNQQPILSQPPPISCSHEQRRPQVQKVIPQRVEKNTNPQSNCTSENNNQWKITSSQNVVQQTRFDEPKGVQLYEIDDPPNNTEKNNPSECQIQQVRQGPVKNSHQLQAVQEQESVSEIARIVRNNCRIHDIEFKGDIKPLEGRLYRTANFFIAFGDHYRVQIVGDVIVNTIDDYIAFEAFFGPENPIFRK